MGRQTGEPHFSANQTPSPILLRQTLRGENSQGHLRDKVYPNPGLLIPSRPSFHDLSHTLTILQIPRQARQNPGDPIFLILPLKKGSTCRASMGPLSLQQAMGTQSRPNSVSARLQTPSVTHQNTCLGMAVQSP